MCVCVCVKQMLLITFSVIIRWYRLPYQCFNQNETREISTLTGGSLKLLDKLTDIS